uniref:Uncharacterized protein n=1 Tax=Arundo donax TaxID=35708 RepID=A0A0A9APT6_ARUDO
MPNNKVVSCLLRLVREGRKDA